MSNPLKRADRVATTIVRIDRKTQAVTAGVNFEDIDLRINGEGSEVYDYQRFFVLHTLNTGLIREKILGTETRSRDYMAGQVSTADATSNASSANTNVGVCRDADFPSFSSSKITGYIGNKRHIDSLLSRSQDVGTGIFKQSEYTSDTSTEIESIQYISTVNSTITYTLIIVAVPKIQYNPHAILLKHKKLTNHTADIIFGGVNDTEGVDDLDGDVYDYVAVSSGLTSGLTLTGRVNEVSTGNRIHQNMGNANGSIASNNAINKSSNLELKGTSESIISADTGRKKLTTYSINQGIANQQIERGNWDPDTATKMTSLLLISNGSISGDVSLYAVPKGYNADLIPWRDQEIVNIAGDFSAGHSFDIPSDALFMKWDFAGEGIAFFSLDFNSLGVAVDRQFLQSIINATQAGFGSTNSIGAIGGMSKNEGVVSLKSGANRPILAQSQYREDIILIQGSWVKDSSTVLTSAQFKASNTNTINGLLTVSFY